MMKKHYSQVIPSEFLVKTTKTVLSISCFFTLFTVSAQTNTLPPTGNVGIGTTSPSSRLQVNGTAKIDSSLIVKDSVTIKKNLRVEENVNFLGQTKMNNTRVFNNFVSDNSAKFNGIVKMPNLELPATLNNKNVVLTNTNGALKRISLDSLALYLKQQFYFPIPNFEEMPCLIDLNGNTIYETPFWQASPQRLYVLSNQCMPDLKVGIRTANPTHGLHVNSDARFSQAKVDINMGIGADQNSFTTLFIKNTNRNAGIQINQVDNNHSYQKLISLEYSEPTTEILKAVNTQTGVTSYLFESNGKITINNGTQKILQLETNGLLRARKVKVDTDAWADYVFKPTYSLMTLYEVEEFIQKYGHLPNMPSEKDVKENGVDLVEMNIKLLEKVEELTLHTIQLQKELKEMQLKLSNIEK